MCLLAFAIDMHDDYPFVFIGNRDEMHARPTREAHWWDDAPQVFGGRDLAAGGSWLGVDRTGRFAVLTNFRDPGMRRMSPPSRGELVRLYLAGEFTMDDMHAHLVDAGDRYDGFSLVYGDIARRRFWFFSNAEAGAPRTISPGLHGLSNHLLDTPWPKVRKTRERLAGAIDTGRLESEHLLDLLDDPDTAAPDELPDTGIPKDWELRLSAAKIVSPQYGTRASSCMRLHRSGEVHVTERSFDPDGKPTRTVTARFELPSPSGNMDE